MTCLGADLWWVSWRMSRHSDWLGCVRGGKICEVTREPGRRPVTVCVVGGLPCKGSCWMPACFC